MVEELDLSTEEEMKGKRIEPGWYHFAVVDNARNKDNNAMLVTVEVLAGNVADQQGRRLQSFFNDPSPTHKDGGTFAKALRTKLLLALGIITPDLLGKRASIDWAKTVGRQFIGLVALEKGKDDKDYPKLQQGEMYRVDDPTMAHVPKDQAALSLISGMTPAPASQPAAQPAAAAPAAAPVSAPPAAAPATAAADPFAGL